MFRMPMAVVYRFLPLCFPFVALVISLGLVAPLFHSNCSCAVSFPLLPAISRVFSAVFLFSLPLFAMLCFYSCICIFMTLGSASHVCQAVPAISLRGWHGSRSRTTFLFSVISSTTYPSAPLSTD